MADALKLNFDLVGATAMSRNLGLIMRDVDQAEKRAIGTLRRRLPVQARRDIQAEYSLTASRVNKDLRGSDTFAGVRLTGYFRGVGLRNYSARQTRRGVTAAVLRGKRTLRAGAFIRPMLGGNEQVVKREGVKRRMTKGRYVGQLRQPLAVQYGASVAQMLRKGRRPERLADYARGVLQAEMQRLLRQSNGP